MYNYAYMSDLKTLPHIVTLLAELQALILSGNCISNVKSLESMTQLNTLGRC